MSTNSNQEKEKKPNEGIRYQQGSGRTAVKEMVKHKMVDVLGTAGHAQD